jgi:putative ABC transport system substrate-binding protein
MVGSGLAAQLSRPGGNTTGLSILTPELDVKRLEILHELVPQVQRIAVLADPTTISTAPQLASAARGLNVGLVWFKAQSPEEIGRELDAIAVAKVEAVSVLGSALMYAARRTIIERTRAERLPAIYHLPETAAEGALLAYGPRLQLCYQLVVSLVDKILRGKPADLPIEQPSKFALVINMRTAQALGLTVPQTLLARADEVIE